MRLLILIIALVAGIVQDVEALSVSHSIKAEIGMFDAGEKKFEYSFFGERDYDVKIIFKTRGAFRAIYPFDATYHAVGTYDKTRFYPQDYFYDTKAFKHRTKEIVYENGEPIYRISTKNDKKRKDEIKTDSQYKTSNDMLTLFAELTRQILDGKKCDFEQYAYDGKRYTKVSVKYSGKEKLKTPYFKGRAMKCEMKMKTFDDDDSGLFDNDEPVYIWILNDEKTGIPFLAKILIESTQFGKLEALTTEIEVKNAK